MMQFTVLNLAVILCGLSIITTVAATSTCQTCDQINVNIEVDGDKIKLHWTLNTSDTSVLGFRAIFYDEEKTVLYESPIMHISQREITIRQELTGDTSICIQIIGDNSTIIYEKCELLDTTDLKAVVGILAGTIFLIPCVIGLIYIIYKDRRVTKAMDYEKLEHISIPGQDSPTTQIKSKLVETGKVNLAFKDEANVTVESEQDTSNEGSETDSRSTASLESEVTESKADLNNLTPDTKIVTKPAEISLETVEFQEHETSKETTKEINNIKETEPYSIKEVDRCEIKSEQNSASEIELSSAISGTDNQVCTSQTTETAAEDNVLETRDTDNQGDVKVTPATAVHFVNVKL